LIRARRLTTKWAAAAAQLMGAGRLVGWVVGSKSAGWRDTRLPILFLHSILAAAATATQPTRRAVFVVVVHLFSAAGHSHSGQQQKHSQPILCTVLFDFCSRKWDGKEGGGNSGRKESGMEWLALAASQKTMNALPSILCCFWWLLLVCRLVFVPFTPLTVQLFLGKLNEVMNDDVTFHHQIIDL